MSQHARPRIEPAFGWLKTTAWFCEVKLRGLSDVDWLFVFASAAFNLIRLPKLLAQPDDDGDVSALRPSARWHGGVTALRDRFTTRFDDMSETATAMISGFSGPLSALRLSAASDRSSMRPSAEMLLSVTISTFRRAHDPPLGSEQVPIHTSARQKTHADVVLSRWDASVCCLQAQFKAATDILLDALAHSIAETQIIRRSGLAGSPGCAE